MDNFVMKSQDVHKLMQYNWNGVDAKGHIMAETVVRKVLTAPPWVDVFSRGFPYLTHAIIIQSKQDQDVRLFRASSVICEIQVGHRGDSLFKHHGYAILDRNLQLSVGPFLD